MEGWVTLYRKFLEWEWFDDVHMVKLFIYLMLKASTRDRTWRGISIKRGQLITTLQRLSEDLNMSVKMIRTRLGRLEKTGEISKKMGRQTGNQFSVITLNKYDCYQFKMDEGAGKGADEGQTKGKPGATVRKSNRGKKERIFVRPTLEQVKEYCAERGNKIDPQYFIDKNNMVGWVYGKNNTPIKDWKAAIRTWEKFSDKEDNGRGFA